MSPRDPGGLAIGFATHAELIGERQAIDLTVPFAPGLIRTVRISGWGPMLADRPIAIHLPGGSVALDGERELVFADRDRVTLTLKENAFPTVDVPGCLHLAAAQGLFRQFPTSP